MDLHAILTSTPIDRVARRAVSQLGAAVGDTPLTRTELVALVNRINRKQRLLKVVLGIKTRAQHTNAAYKASKGIKQYRAAKEPRAMTEYLRCGREVYRLTNELAELRKLRRFVAEAEHETQALMAQKSGGEV
jgi:hypothetical protein